MAKKKLFYSYTHCNVRVKANQSFYDAAAILTIPLSQFEREKGCTKGGAWLLSNSDIGKEFDVKILDPVKLGTCTLLGFGFKAIPISELRIALTQYRNYITNEFVVFTKKVGEKQILVVVKRMRCDTTPIKKKR